MTTPDDLFNDLSHDCSVAVHLDAMGAPPVLIMATSPDGGEALVVNVGLSVDGPSVIAYAFRDGERCDISAAVLDESAIVSVASEHL